MELLPECEHKKNIRLTFNRHKKFSLAFQGAENKINNYRCKTCQTLHETIDQDLIYDPVITPPNIPPITVPAIIEIFFMLSAIIKTNYKISLILLIFIQLLKRKETLVM